jgi:hypothetical protein
LTLCLFDLLHRRTKQLLYDPSSFSSFFQVNDEFTRREAVGVERQVNSEGSATHISSQHMISAEAFASRALE